ncbi:MAG: phosphate ABC transporter substrate-binding protein PstS [Ectothiorhodospira sp.]
MISDKSLKTFSLGAAVASAVMAGSTAMAATIDGAGASFPYPVYSQWASDYEKETGNQMNYQSIGSGGGIKQITSKTVDFGASDAPLKPERLEKEGLVQWPMVMGGVVPVVNLEGVEPGELQLSNEILAQIFLGNIDNWNDPAIAELNPGLDLPDQQITVAHRSDGSGTTFVFTDFLSKVSDEWDEEVGRDTTVSWPTGVGAKGNEGVSNYSDRLSGSIGYVEYAYALENDLTHVQLQNRDGEWVQPESEAFQAAAAGADWENAEGNYLLLTDQPGADSWPITAATFILMHTEQEDPEAAKNALDFFAWAYENGDEAALDLHYVPMPESVVSQMQEMWKEEIRAEDGSRIWEN